jgi:hypothetical protein
MTLKQNIPQFIRIQTRTKDAFFKNFDSCGGRSRLSFVHW